MSSASMHTWGGSKQAIQFHYDLNNDFFGLWLDESRTYSSALWGDRDDAGDLGTAQKRKLDFHIEQSGAPGAERMLDIGCGWGSLLRRAVEVHGVGSAVGLTLSNAQASYVESLRLPRVQVLKESWATHQPKAPYDAIVSIGAFEHFASPSEPVETRIAVYRDFFERCSTWLSRGGKLSLQTIAYGTLRPEDANAFIKTDIFPDSELPRLGEIVASTDGIFEIVLLRNDRSHYARTCELWLAALRAQRTRALELVGETTVLKYERYLKLASVGFAMGKLNLLRIVLRPIIRGWGTRPAD